MIRYVEKDGDNYKSVVIYMMTMGKQIVSDELSMAAFYLTYGEAQYDNPNKNPIHAIRLEDLGEVECDLAEEDKEYEEETEDEN